MSKITDVLKVLSKCEPYRPAKGVSMERARKAARLLLAGGGVCFVLLGALALWHKAAPAPLQQHVAIVFYVLPVLLSLLSLIVEPVAGNMGCVPPGDGYLKGVRDLCTKHGALLIFDEVMTGFRVALGGAEEHYRVSPDITTFGKVIGGGLPVGAFGATKDIMSKLAPEGPIYQAGTLSGNPLAVAAGIATLKELREDPPYARLEQLGQRLIDGLRAAAAASGLPHHLARVGSMWTLFFNDQPVTDYDSARRSDTARFARFFWAMLGRGVYLPCSQFEAAFLSAAHTEEHIDQTIAAAREALAEIG